MLKIAAILILSLFAIYEPVRPPVPEVPFEYDLSRCTSDTLKALEVRTSNRIIYIPLHVIEPDGEYGVLTCDDPNVTVPPAVTTIDPADPNGISRIHSYLCSVRVGLTKRVIYQEYTFTDDPNGEDYLPMSDSRMVLIDVRKRNRKPVLDWGL